MAQGWPTRVRQGGAPGGAKMETRKGEKHVDMAMRKGDDTGKKVSGGRITVDTQGLPHTIAVTVAEGGKAALGRDVRVGCPQSNAKNPLPCLGEGE